MSRALITGITGQDGSYLADLLLEKGYEVHGLVRNSAANRARISHLDGNPRVHLHHGDLTDGEGLIDLLDRVRPAELYHLGAASHVAVSFEAPQSTMEINATGTQRLLEALERSAPDCRFFQASSAEIFGSTAPPQDEHTACEPRSPYGMSKLRAHQMTGAARARGLFAASGILFNHESPRRGENFVTRKITRAVAAIKAGLTDRVELGNLNAVRDWGYAPEYVEGMWRMLQASEPDDYVLATGAGHSVREFCEAAFSHVDLNWADHVLVNQDFLRPIDTDLLIGDAGKARQRLGWTAHTHAPDLARLMVDADVAQVARTLAS